MNERIDHILGVSGLEQDFIRLALAEAGIDPSTTGAKRHEGEAGFRSGLKRRRDMMPVSRGRNSRAMVRAAA